MKKNTNLECINQKSQVLKDNDTMCQEKVAETSSHIKNENIQKSKWFKTFEKYDKSTWGKIPNSFLDMLQIGVCSLKEFEHSTFRFWSSLAL